MKKKIKVTFSILFFFFFFIQLMGCDGKRYKTLKITKDAFNDQLPPATITMILPGYQPDEWKDIKKALEEKLEPTLNVKLNFQWVREGSYEDSIKYRIEHGNTIDAVIISKDACHDDLQKLLNEGAIQDITPYLETDGKKLRNIYSKEELENVTYNDKIAVLPSHFPKSNRVIFSLSNTLIKLFPDRINSDTKIQNYDDIINFLTLNKNLDLCFDLNTFQLFGEPTGYVNLGYGLVYKIDDPEMKIIPWEQTEVFKQGVAIIQDWQKNGKCDGNRWTVDGHSLYKTHESLMEYFSQGYHGCIFSTYSDLDEYTRFYGLQNDTFKTFPIIGDTPSTISLDTQGVAIYRGSKNASRVVQFFQWLETSQENYDFFMYGIKDKDYTLENERISFPKNKSRYYGWDGSKPFLNIDYMREENYDNYGYKDEYKDITLTQSKYPPTVGFHINASKIDHQLQSRLVDMNAFELRVRSLEFGEIEEELKKFNEQQIKNQVDYVVNEAQEQLDQWKANSLEEAKKEN